MKPLLTSDDCARIENTIAAIEQTTAGEIVVVVRDRSHPYGLWRALFTGAVTLLYALLATWYGDVVLAPLSGDWGGAVELDVTWILIGQIPAALLFWWISGRAPLLRLLAPNAIEIAAVEARAKEAFFDAGVMETRDRSGVLIFISQLERRVHILADKGIHARVGAQEWEHDVATIVTGIRSGDAAGGIAAAVESIGAHLAEFVPRRPDDTNELPNHVLIV